MTDENDECLRKSEYRRRRTSATPDQSSDLHFRWIHDNAKIESELTLLKHESMLLHPQGTQTRTDNVVIRRHIIMDGDALDVIEKAGLCFDDGGFGSETGETHNPGVSSILNLRLLSIFRTTGSSHMAFISSLQPAITSVVSSLSASLSFRVDPPVTFSRGRSLSRAVFHPLVELIENSRGRF